MSTVDDPVVWGFRGFPSTNANLAPWVLAGIYQENMSEALDRLSDGAWITDYRAKMIEEERECTPQLHTFPEGKVSQEVAPLRRLKWGTTNLIVRAPVTPIVLPIVHRGFQEVMPENYLFGRRPPFPLCNKKIKVVIGDPLEFDLPRLKHAAMTMSRSLPFSPTGWPSTSEGLDEAAQRCLYLAISDKIQFAMERLRRFGETL